MRYQLKAKVTITVTGGQNTLQEFEDAMARIKDSTGRADIGVTVDSTRMQHQSEDQT